MRSINNLPQPHAGCLSCLFLSPSLFFFPFFLHHYLPWRRPSFFIITMVVSVHRLARIKPTSTACTNQEIWERCRRKKKNMASLKLLFINFCFLFLKAVDERSQESFWKITARESLGAAQVFFRFIWFVTSSSFVQLTMCKREDLCCLGYTPKRVLGIRPLSF